METSVTKAALCLIAVYYCLNYEYSPHVQRPLQFLPRYFLKIQNPGVNDSVKELALMLPCIEE